MSRLFKNIKILSHKKELQTFTFVEIPDKSKMLPVEVGTSSTVMIIKHQLHE